MKNSAKWGIGLGVGIPAALILIGLLCLIIKFFMKRCRKKPWNDITTPSGPDSLETGGNHWKFPKRRTSERQLLCQSTSSSNNITDTSDLHISIHIDQKDIPSDQRTQDNQKTLVQIQRDRLNRLKEEEETRVRPTLRLAYDENEVQRAIDQVQKEFEDSV